MRRLDDDERRARLGRRQFLAAHTIQAPETVAAELVGLHASDPATVFLSLRARLPARSVADVERALYDDRSLLKVLAMRRTMFVVPVGLVPVLQAACTDTIAATEHRRLISQLSETDLGDRAGPWVEQVLAEALTVIEADGPLTGTQLSAAVPELRRQLTFGEGTKWAGAMSITTRVVTILSAQGHIVRGRPRGTLISSQYEWVATDQWLSSRPEPWPTADAEVELVRRWLAAFGPGTIADLTWWTGWGLRQTRAAVAALDTVEVTLDGTDEPGVVLADDIEPVPAPAPWVALLPGLDPTPMGWKGRDWYLGTHRPLLFDRNGNIGPTVWCDGRIVGGWAHRDSGEVAVRLLDDVGAEAAAAIEAEAAHVSGWLGAAQVRVRARFPTPLERELMA